MQPDDPMLQRMRATAPNEPQELNRILRFDLHCSLPGDMLHKVDLASMYHSLEVRVPLLDVRLVEEVIGLPAGYKISRGLRKRVLADAHRDLLPDAILQRSKKGFEVPMGEYLRGPLRELYRATVTRDVVESLGLLDYAALEQVYANHCAQRAEHADLLYAVLVLCRWRNRSR
jgi:asparagine synthase (glutamine-hydrolysing)